MILEYDEVKNRRNLAKHHISFETASVFIDSDNDPDIEFDEDHSSSNETRYRGTFRWNDHYLFIVYTMRNDAVRIISVRLATKVEIEWYYERGGEPT